MRKEIGGFGMVDMVILRSTDSEGTSWVPVLAKDVPLWITGNPEVIAQLRNGMGAQAPDEEVHWIGQAVTPETTRFILPATVH